MKRSHLFATLALGVAFALPAQATFCKNGAMDYPKCTPPTSTPATPNSTSSSTSTSGDSKSSAVSKSGSVSKSGAESVSGSTLTDNSVINAGAGDYKSNMWVFPAPVFTPPLPMTQCPNANVKNMAASGGWSFLSYAEGSVNTDNCTAIILYNKYIETCQYESAQKLLRRLEQRVLPGADQAVPVDYVNLDRRGCDALKVPLPPVPVVAPPTVYVAPPTGLVACQTPAPTPTKGKPAKRKAKPPVECKK